MIPVNIIRQLPFATRLTSAAQRELAARAVERRFRTGEVLFRAGDAPHGLHVILEERVRVLRGVGGRSHVLHVEGPGGTLGVVPLFGGGSYLATAIAAEPVRCVLFPRDAIHAAMTADTTLAWMLLAGLAGRVRILAARLERVTARHVTARVAELVLARATRSSHPTFTLGGTQTEVAEELGTVREVVVRSLRELRTCSAIRSAGGGRYRITDLRLLEDIARGDRSR